MNVRRTAKKAFTLVEILIVVVILGILAAIVVPQFTNATQDAQGGNLKAQLDTLNNQVELFRARTNAYPDFATDGWTKMISGGYIKTSPKNPVNGSSTFGSSATDGWYWHAATNTLCATNFNNDKNDTTNDADGVYGSITVGRQKDPS
ncbi:MAG: prepilin-type N-terminal cleavage/methylation domain-containing protein [Planctomycetota bacterium]|nr:prepilin-type N-terminal cleavage/methylation domain-containing protein [Planctomycetota bacterium]